MEKCTSETIAEALEADLASGRWKTGERLLSVAVLLAAIVLVTRWGLTPLYSERLRDQHFCFESAPRNFIIIVL